MRLAYTTGDYATYASRLSEIIAPTISLDSYTQNKGRFAGLMDYIAAGRKLPISAERLHGFETSTASGDHPDPIVNGRLYGHSIITEGTRVNATFELALPGEKSLVSQVNHIGQPTSGEEAVKQALEGLIYLYDNPDQGDRVIFKGSNSESRCLWNHKYAA